MDIFERAARTKLRFPSNLAPIGELTVEQLWDLPLTGKAGRIDLDTLARATFGELKGIEEASFVDTKPNPNKVLLELRLDILKHVIKAKQDAAVAAEKAAATRAYKEKLLHAKSSKEEQKLANMSEAEIDAELAKLSDAA